VSEKVAPPSDQASILRRVLWLVLPALGACFAITLAVGSAVAPVIAAAAIPVMIALRLTRSGKASMAALLTLASMLGLASYELYRGEGLQDIGVLAYPVIVLGAGLLLDRRRFVLLVCGALLSLLWIAHGQSTGFVTLMVERQRPYIYSDLLIAVVIMGVAAATVSMLAEGQRRSLADARRNAQALRASEEKFNKAFRSSPSIMAIVRMADGTFLEVNEAFSEVTGYSRDDVVGRAFADLELWADVDERNAIIGALVSGGTVRGMAMRFRRKSGEIGVALVSGDTVELDGVPCGLYSVMDITDRRRAEQALAASEERYRLISGVMSDYTFSSVVDAEGRVRQEWVAGAFEPISGYSFDEYMVRGGWFAALHPDDREQDARDLEALRKNQPVVSEVRTITKAGSLRWVRVYAHPVWDAAADRLAGIYGAVQDVTERRQVEAEREALIRELEAKNAELERFTYTVSHDLKSPLITVRGYLGYVEQDAASGNLARLKEDIERISSATVKMQRLLDELLELSRIGRVANSPEAVPFGDVVRDAVGLVAGQIAARGVRVEIQDELPAVWGDRPRLVEVLQNLIDNAVKFMGEQAQPRVEVGARREAGRTVFYVRDNGIGIDGQYHEKVFGLFDKLDAKSEGTGVGLALVKRIVEVHGGRIWVESAGAGTGAAFCFTLVEGPV
jgi:PAS domain S-box-containing protein